MSRAQITRVAAYGLVTRNQHILLCRISQQVSAHAGAWTLPGGGIEFGEDPQDAMVREVYEETGYRISASGLAGVDSAVLETERGPMHGIRILYFSEVLGGRLRYELDGTTDFCAWQSREQAGALELVDLARVGIALAFDSNGEG